MAAITLITTTPFVKGPETSYEYYYGLIPGAGWVNFGKKRQEKNRKTYMWTASGSQGNRDLPASEQASPGGDWYVENRIFQEQTGSETASTAAGLIYGTYIEVWCEDGDEQYLDPDTGAWTAT